MEREIIFRGKRVDNGEWVDGDLLNHDNRVGIHNQLGDGTMNVIDVDPETVGQYTGLKDYKGNMIFDGDVLVGYNTYNFKVCIENGHTFIKWVDDGERISEYLGRIYIKENDVEVIGNIHDNPELLEV